MATQEQKTQLLTLLVGMFDAAPTQEIFSYLEGLVDDGATVGQVSQAIVASEYFTGLYADADAFVAGFPTALVGDYVSEEVLAAATDIVEGRLAAGESIAAVIEYALNALDNVSAENETWGAAAAALDNKVAVAQYFVDTVAGSGYASVAEMQAILANVTQDAATVTAANAETDTLAAELDAIANAGETFTLTTATDDILVGTAKNDTFEGALTSSTATTTIQVTDTIVDQSTTDNDTANLSLNAALPAMKIVNVENVNLTIAATGAVSNDVSNLSGVKNLTITKTDLEIAGASIVGNKDVTVTKLSADDVAAVTVAGTARDVSVDQTAGTAADSVAGVTVNADVATGAVSVTGAATVNAGAATGNVTVTAIDVAPSATFTQNDKAVVVNAGTTTGTVSINASGTSYKFGGDITVNAANAVTVDINNDADAIDAANAVSGAVTVNAAKATDVNVDDATWGAVVNAATEHGANATVTVEGITSNGATITSGAGSTTNSLTIELGGTALTTDVANVSASGAVTLDVAKSTGAVDTINVSGNGADVTYTLARSQASDLTTLAASGDYKVNVTTDTAYISGKTVSGVETLKLTQASGATVNLSKVDAKSIDVGYAIAGNAVTVANGANLVLSTNAGGDAEFVTSTAGDVFTLNVGDTNGSANTATPTFTATNLDVSAVAGSATSAGSVTLNATTGGATMSTGVKGGQYVDLIVEGTKDVNLGTVDVLKSVDASASSGKLTLTAANSGNATVDTIVTGSGGSAIILNEADVFTVTGGAGVDDVTLTKASANTVLSLGAGNDVVKNLGSSDSAGSMVIATGAGDDEVRLVGASDAIISFGEGSGDQLTVSDDADVAAYASGAYTYQNFAFTGAEKVDIASTKTLTLSATQLSQNASFALSGAGALAIEGNLTGANTGTGVASTIDLSGVTRASGVTATVTVTGSSKADTITGTSGADTFKASAGADVIVGGDGVDTYDASGFGDLGGSSITLEGSTAGTQKGVVINLGADAVANTTILAATGLYTADTVTSVAANTVAYQYTASGSANSAVTQSLSGIETVIGTSGKDYIVAGSAGNTITGGAGADTIVLGAGNDTVIFTTSATADTVTKFETTKDTLNVDAVLTDGDVTLVSSAFTTFSGTGTATDNAIVNYANSAALADTAAVVALFEATDSDGAKMVLADGDQVIFVVQDNNTSTDTDFDAQIFVVTSNSGISAALVGTISADGDSAQLVVGDFA